MLAIHAPVLIIDLYIPVVPARDLGRDLRRVPRAEAIVTPGGDVVMATR
jgi:hypothetical protein